MSRESMLKKSTVKSPYIAPVKKILRKHGLFSVCESAHCPNIGECFRKKTATFLILGTICTRSCGFCNIPDGRRPGPVDKGEPGRLADAVREMQLKYAVITSVTRDDLPDGGASHFAEVIRAVREQSPHTLIEVLTPDFQGERNAFEAVAEKRPDIFNHNLETVPRLYSRVRPQADYGQSLEMLGFMKEKGLVTKSGIMVGLGETAEEIEEVMDDLVAAGCDILTIGQYFAPSRNHLPVVRDYEEHEFEVLREKGLKKGFAEVYAGRFVRSSFNAHEIAQKIR